MRSALSRAIIGQAPEALRNVSAVGNLGRADLAFATPAARNIHHVTTYRVPSGAALNRVSHFLRTDVVAPGASYNLVDGDATRANLLVNGDFAVDANWTKGTGWTIAAGKATKAAGVSATLTQLVSLIAGSIYRCGYTVAGRTAGTVRQRLTGGTSVEGVNVSTNARQLGQLTAVTGNTTFGFSASSTFDGSLDDAVFFEQTLSCAPQGLWDYYLEPFGASGVAGPVSGPFAATII